MGSQNGRRAVRRGESPFFSRLCGVFDAIRVGEGFVGEDFKPSSGTSEIWVTPVGEICDLPPMSLDLPQFVIKTIDTDE